MLQLRAKEPPVGLSTFPCTPTLRSLVNTNFMLHAGGMETIHQRGDEVVWHAATFEFILYFPSIDVVEIFHVCV